MSIQTSAELRMNIRQAFDGKEVEKLQLQGPSGQETDHYGIFMKETGECHGLSSPATTRTHCSR